MKSTNPEFKSQSKITAVGHFINGKRVSGGKDIQEVYNPADGRVLRTVAMGTTETVGLAIGAAQDAFPEWRKLPPSKRSRVMFRF